MPYARKYWRNLPLIGALLERYAVEPPVVQTETLLFNGERIPIRGVDVTQGGPFTSRVRTPSRIKQILVHESVTRSAAATESVLRRRKIMVGGRKRANQLGVHIVIGAHGGIIQHNDLVDRLIHAGGHNGQSIGVEIVNPYYPKNLRVGLAWSTVIRARWAHKQRYVVPTRAQLESFVAVLRALFDAGFPQEWPGVSGGRISMSRHEGLRTVPGVQAHAYSAHADGAFPVLYAYLRIERGFDAGDAYAESIRLATNAGRTISLEGLSND